MEDKLPFGLKIARFAATKSTYQRKPVGCAFIVGSKIISDSNQSKTSPLAASLGSRYHRNHAEMNVLKNVEDGSHGTLYVFRATKDGNFAQSAPCAFCMKLLKEKNIRRVVHTIDGGFTKMKLTWD